MTIEHVARFVPCLLLILAVLVTSARAQESYRKPSDDIVDILTAPPLPGVSVDPTGRTMLLSERLPMPKLSDMARPMLRLAGQRIDPATNGSHRTNLVVGLMLRDLDGGNERRVDLPEGTRIGGTRWSPDGERIAFTITRDDGIELWVIDVATAEARRLTDATVNGLGGFSWLGDARSLLVHFVPDGRGSEPQRAAVPTGPVVQETSGRAAPVRTYQDLLEDPHDEALFDHYFTSQLAIVDAGEGARRNIASPAVHAQASVAPDGRHILIARVRKPYSYMVPMWSFSTDVVVHDLQTGSERHILRTPLAEEVPIGGVVDGPRGHRWRTTAGTSALLWTEALDGGDPKREVAHRDRLLMLEAPFDGDPVEIARFEDRFRGLTWIEGTSLAMAGEYDRDERWERSWLLDVERDAEPRLVYERNVQDRYADRGRPVSTLNRAGKSVAKCDGTNIWFSGPGASPDGDRPFLDVLSLETLETKRLWRAEGECYESFVDFLPGDQILTRYETTTTPPNYMTRDLSSGERAPLTHFEHPAPQLRDVHKEMVTYTRADGVPLQATLYLPPGYDADRDEPLPLLVWAYPREFNDARTAGQVSGSPYRFTSIRGSSHLFMLLEGYAIMDGATMPIVGADPETVNDTFIDQIVSSADAAIQYAAGRGVADPSRVGVGGHSYGAFMTANLMAHSDLFRAGVARSGAYNRTLTPFGFQSERRTFWEAPEVYFALSPFMHADHINEPLLLVHGAEDNNSGTFPIQSERLYHALKGHGGTTRLVMLPHESHGYRAEESIMHVLAEMSDWFERYVKVSD